MIEPAVVQRLTSFWVLEGFTQTELAQISQFATEESYPSGKILFQQGDLPDFFYLVEEGAVREVGKDAAGRVSFRRNALAGDYLGSWSFLQNEPRRTTASVSQNSRLLSFQGDDFQTVLAMFPRLEDSLRRIDVVNRLLAIPLFAAFTKDQLLHAAELARSVEYSARQNIFHQGEPSDAFYVIDTGQVVERVTGPAPGKQTWPKFFSAGSFFGRHGLLTRTARRASADAVTDVHLYRFDADDFHWLCQLQPGFEAALKRPDVLSHLQQIGALSQLNEEELSHLAGYVGLARFRPRDVLYRQGELDPTLYMLYEGEAILRARDVEGKERPLGYLQGGDAVGESSLFLKEPRDVTLEATTPTNWFYLTRKDLDQFLVQRPELEGKVVPSEKVAARSGLRRLKWMEPGELLIMRKRRHWYFLLERLVWPLLMLLVALIIFLALGPFGVFGWVLVPFAMLWMIWRFADWLNDYYIVTTSRVAHREKLLLVQERRDETPLDKIQNINVERGLIGNLFGFGTLVLDTAATSGASRVTFDHLGEPDKVQQMVFEQISRARGKERVDTRKVIRKKLEGTMGVGIRPVVPRPAVPLATPPTAPSPPGPGILSRINEITFRRWFWIERREPGRIIWRKHWGRLIRRIWAPVLALIAVILATAAYRMLVGATMPAVSLLFAFFGLLCAGWILWEWENWGNDQYIVTDDRIIDIEALPLGFRTRRTETTFDRIQNVSFDIPSPMATLLNYGTVIIHTAGAEGRLDFEWVRDPKWVQAEIFRRLGSYEEAQRRRQRDESWADLPQWFAEYERRSQAL